MGEKNKWKNQNVLNVIMIKLKKASFDRGMQSFICFRMKVLGVNHHQLRHIFAQTVDMS